MQIGIESAFILGLSLVGAVAVDFAVTYPKSPMPSFPSMPPLSAVMSGTKDVRLLARGDGGLPVWVDAL